MTSKPPSPADGRSRADGSLEARRAELAQKLGLPAAESLPLITLPANRTLVRPLAERRKERFRAHLARVIDEAFTSPLSSAPPRTSVDDGTSPLLGEACATCRGRCCHAGGEHAFLDVATIQAYRRAHPDATREDIAAAYSSRLAEEVYDRGCVFQAADGCRLPRTMRADICNSFLCTPLHELRAIEASRPAHVLLAAQHGDRLVRSALIGNGSPPTRVDLDDE